METLKKYDLGPNSHGKTMPWRMYKTLQTSPLFANYATKERQKLDRFDIQEITKIFEDNYSQLKELFSYEEKPLHETLEYFGKCGLGTSGSFYDVKKKEIIDNFLSKNANEIIERMLIGAQYDDTIRKFGEEVNPEKLLHMDRKMRGTFTTTVRDILDRIESRASFTIFFNDIDTEKLAEILGVMGKDTYVIENIIDKVDDITDLIHYVRHSDIDTIVSEMKDYKSLIAILNEE